MAGIAAKARLRYVSRASACPWGGAATMVRRALSQPSHCPEWAKCPAPKAPARRDGQALALRLRRAPGSLNESGRMTRPSGPLLFILATLMIDAIGIGIVFPIMPDLMARVGAGDLAQGSIWAGVLMAAYAGAQFLFAPVVGSLSDAFGRRPVLLSRAGAPGAGLRDHGAGRDALAPDPGPHARGAGRGHLHHGDGLRRGHLRHRGTAQRASG
jgi:hypothetical protein